MSECVIELQVSQSDTGDRDAKGSVFRLGAWAIEIAKSNSGRANRHEIERVTWHEDFDHKQYWEPSSQFNPKAPLAPENGAVRKDVRGLFYAAYQLGGLYNLDSVRGLKTMCFWEISLL